MSAVADEELDALLDDLPAKRGAQPLKRTKKQIAAQERRAEADEAAKQLAIQQGVQKARAAQLAQIVNLHIGGYSMADIAASIGGTIEDVERMLATETQAYVRTQPALRTYVRNFVSGNYTELLDAVINEATDRTHPDKLENSLQAVRILERMARLHGADAPTQSEVKIEAAPEAVDRIVKALAAREGLGYDTSIFDDPDIIDVEVVHEAVEQSHAALETASQAVEVSGNHDEEGDGDDEL